MTLVADEYRIRLDGIRFRAHHGVTDSERNLPQDFLVTVEVTLPVSTLPRGDHYRDVFDYDRLASLVVEEGTTQTCRLLETLASRVIARVLHDTPATRVRVSVTKSRPPTASSVDSVAVELVGVRPAPLALDGRSAQRAGPMWPGPGPEMGAGEDGGSSMVFGRGLSAAGAARVLRRMRQTGSFEPGSASS